MLLSRYLTKYSHIISLSKIYYTTALSTLCKALLILIQYIMRNHTQWTEFTISYISCVSKFTENLYITTDFFQYGDLGTAQ